MQESPTNDNNSERVTEIKIMNKYLIISHSVGALLMDLELHSVFAGKEGEEDSRDGTVSYCRFYGTTGIAVEFDNVIYVCDRSVGLVKIIKALKEAVSFLTVYNV